MPHFFPQVLLSPRYTVHGSQRGLRLRCSRGFRTLVGRFVEFAPAPQTSQIFLDPMWPLVVVLAYPTARV